MFIIPYDRLPPGFGERVESPPEPAAPAPAATVVLLRDGAAGPEALLLKRHRQSGFVPGAYVFPGGRVDAADADPRLSDFLIAAPAAEPPLEYWVAAAREAFEETGVLLARNAQGGHVADSGADAGVRALREQLLEDGATLVDVLMRLDARLDLEHVVYCAHWVTPVAEPRRFDTRFFLAQLPAGATVAADPREMVDAQWLTPADAVQRFHEGRLPMVFPTVRTLETLCGYDSTAALLDAFRGRSIDEVLPRLVRTDAGVGIVVDEEENG